MACPDAVEAFIVRWPSIGGSEHADYQLFITEPCELLGLTKPEQAEAEHNADVFEGARFMRVLGILQCRLHLRPHSPRIGNAPKADVALNAPARALGYAPSASRSRGQADVVGRARIHSTEIGRRQRRRHLFVAPRLGHLHHRAVEFARAAERPSVQIREPERRAAARHRATVQCGGARPPQAD